MHFVIRHHTRYQYSQPIKLGPQLLRFHPRDDGTQYVSSHQITITPEPTGRNDHLDLEGNLVTEVWFAEKTDHLDIAVIMQVETLRTSASSFLLAPEAASLPISHLHDAFYAQAYLERTAPQDSVTAFAAELSMEVNSNTLDFLDRLNRTLFAEFTHVHRAKGEPQSPAQTLQIRSGACRDLAVLFVDCCRAEGIAARFASGYQRGDLQRERRDLHAWPEVYLPGGGWCGYDPTLGEAVVDTHVTIAAAANPRNTMPVTGTFIGKVATSHLDFTLEIKVLEDEAAGAV